MHLAVTAKEGGPVSTVFAGTPVLQCRQQRNDSETTCTSHQTFSFSLLPEELLEVFQPQGGTFLLQPLNWEEEHKEPSRSASKDKAAKELSKFQHGALGKLNDSLSAQRGVAARHTALYNPTHTPSSS